MSVSVSSGLSVEKVSVAFPGERRRDAPAVAVREVTVEVAPGEVLALLGPSGSGKSTLLRAIAGLEPLADGRVCWAGRDLKDVPVHRRGFALMFQDGQLFPTRTVAANIAYPLKIAGVPRPTQQARADELLELVGLSGFGGRQVTELSGGEQQRVALARAIAAKPRLLLLDEPLSALDRELRERLGLDLRRILVETGTTTVFVTHDHAEAVTVADRVAVLIAGALVQVGTPAELRQTPRTPEVARFFGAGPLGATLPAVPQLEAER